MTLDWDWSQRTNGGRLITWGRFQHLRWLWLGPVFVGWSRR